MSYRVAVVRGGPSSEHQVSLMSGGQVLKSLPTDFEAIDIYISKDGLWHRDGVVLDPSKALRGIDVVFNAMHGEYGEDGQFQRLLDHLNVVYTGAGHLASALAMNKLLSKKQVALRGVQVPAFEYMNFAEYTRDALHVLSDRLIFPVVVKPASAGSSVGVVFVNKVSDLAPAVEAAFDYSQTVLIEEYIKGVEVTGAVLDNHAGDHIYAFYPVEIVNKKDTSIWDYESKYSNELHEAICPARLDPSVKREIQEAAALVHNTLGLRDYSRSDFIYSPERGLYFLEANSLPGLTPASLYPAALRAAGVPFDTFLDHVLKLALKRK